MRYKLVNTANGIIVGGFTDYADAVYYKEFLEKIWEVEIIIIDVLQERK